MMDSNFPTQYVLYTAEASELISWDDGGATVGVAKGGGDAERFSVFSPVLYFKYLEEGGGGEDRFSVRTPLLKSTLLPM